MGRRCCWHLLIHQLVVAVWLLSGCSLIPSVKSGHADMELIKDSSNIFAASGEDELRYKEDGHSILLAHDCEKDFENELKHNGKLWCKDKFAAVVAATDTELDFDGVIGSTHFANPPTIEPWMELPVVGYKKQCEDRNIDKFEGEFCLLTDLPLPMGLLSANRETPCSRTITIQSTEVLSLVEKKQGTLDQKKQKEEPWLYVYTWELPDTEETALMIKVSKNKKYVIPLDLLFDEHCDYWPCAPGKELTSRGGCSSCGDRSIYEATGENSGECKPCGENEVAKDNMCVKCEAGKEVVENMCKACMDGYYRGEKDKQCTLCNYIVSEAKDACTEPVCEAVTSFSQSNLTDRTHSDGPSCANCVGNTFSNNGKQCESCSEGKYAISDHTDCVASCPAGQEGTTESGCQQCPIGKYRDLNVASCTECPEGTIGQDRGASECVSLGEDWVCSPETLADYPGQYCDGPNLKPCESGKYRHPNETTCSTCEGHMYSQEAGATSCQTCSTHRTQESTPGQGNDQCLGCEPGQQEGTDGCEECEDGDYSPTGQKCITCDGVVNDDKNACVPCSDGVVVDGQCQQCTGGTRGEVRGTCECFDNHIAISDSVCVECAAGRFFWQPHHTNGFGNCTQCPKGRYSVQDQQQTCQECHGRSFSDELGSSACKTCGRGQVPETLDDCDGPCACTPCKAGEYLQRYQDLFYYCRTCATGKYTDADSQTTCKLCPRNSFATDDRKHCVCSPGYRKNNTNTVELECTECGLGLDCQNSESPKAATGYWYQAKHRGFPVKCNPTTACTDECGSVECTDSACQSAYIGLGCLECAPNHYRLFQECRECPDSAGASMFWLCLATTMIIALTVLLGKANLQGVNTSLLIFLNFVQTSSLFPKLDIEWPTIVIDYFAMFSVFNFNLQFIHPECQNEDWNYFQGYYIMLSIPLIVPMVITVISTIQWVVHKQSGGFGQLRNDIITRNLAIISILHIQVSSGIFELFGCKNYAVENDDPILRLEQDTSVDCSSQQYQNALSLAKAGVVLFVVGVPIVLAIVLFRIRNKLHDTSVNQRYAFVLERYKMKKSTYMWDLVILLRRLLVALGTLVSDVAADQAVFVLSVVFAFIAMQASGEPYLYPAQNAMEFVSLLAQLTTLLAGLALETVAVKSDPSIANQIGIMVVFFNAAALFFMGLLIAHMVRMSLRGKTKEHKSQDGVQVSDHYRTALRERYVAGRLLKVRKYMQSNDAAFFNEKITQERSKLRKYGVLATEAPARSAVRKPAKRRGEKKTSDRVQAAKVIQARARGRKARNELQQQKKAALTIQSQFRGRKARDETRNMMYNDFCEVFASVRSNLQEAGFPLREHDIDDIWFEIQSEQITRGEWEEYLRGELIQ